MTTKVTYTKIDLVVTMVCVSTLMLCVGAVGLNGREMAKRTVCASNINQHLEALLAYASESDGELPKVGVGNWLQDLSYSHVYKFMQDYGMQKEMFYCPSNPSQQRGMDAYFYFNVSPWDSSNYNLSSFIVAGYCYLLETEFIPRKPIRGSGDKQWLGNIYADNPEQAELVIDTTFSFPLTGDPNYPNGDFQLAGGVFAGASASGMGAGILDSSNHLKTDAEPWGGNIGYLDGHVSWRPFSDMERRYPLSVLNWWW